MRLADFLDAALIRFGLVAVAGLAVDLAVAWSIAAVAGFPLPIAALCGFLVAASGNYVLHERWTFRSGAGLSARRGVLYLALMGATLGVRIGAVTVLHSWVFAKAQVLPPLVLATGFSFLFNFAVSKFLVFRQPPVTAGTASS